MQNIRVSVAMLLFSLTMLFSCSSNADDDENVVVSTVDNPLDKYQISSAYSVEKIGFGNVANDTSKIAVLGLHDNKLVIDIFDAKTAVQQEIFYGKNDIVKEIHPNIGYGVTKTYYIDKINASIIYLTEKGCISCTYTFCGESSLYPDYYLATIDFFTPDNVKSIEANSDIGITEWFNGTYLIDNSDYKSLDLNGRYTCYDISGNSYFSENTGSLEACFYKYQDRKCIPYQIDECIQIAADAQFLPTVRLRKIEVFDSNKNYQEIKITPTDDGRDKMEFDITDYSEDVISLNVEITDWNDGTKTNRIYKINTIKWVLVDE